MRLFAAPFVADCCDAFPGDERKKRGDEEAAGLFAAAAEEFDACERAGVFETELR